MAFGDNVEGTFSIEDAKGKVGSFNVNFPDNVDVPLVTGDFMPTTAQLIDAVVGGKIVNAGVTIGVNLDGVDIKDAPILGSDVEEGATFVFKSVVGAPTRMRLATFDEQFGLETGQAVDTSNADVQAFVQRILQGDTQGLTTVRFADAHGNNVSSLNNAKDAFKKSRKAK